MTNDLLTNELAIRVMGWTIGPDRFLLGDRRWTPRWRFQPAKRLQDAFRLIERAAPEEYSMGVAPSGGFWARIRIAGTLGEACEPSEARAITFAVSRALGIDVGAAR